MCMYQIKIITLINIFLYSISTCVYAHEGEPSHGGDLPVDLGSNRIQYEGRQNLVDVTVSNSAFQPKDLSIDIGGIIAFENRDNIEHRILFRTGEDDPNEEHDHPTGGHERKTIVKPGKSWVLEFLVPGLFPYECTIHGETGKIDVRY